MQASISSTLAILIIRPQPPAFVATFGQRAQLVDVIHQRVQSSASPITSIPDQIGQPEEFTHPPYKPSKNKSQPWEANKQATTHPLLPAHLNQVPRARPAYRGEFRKDQVRKHLLDLDAQILAPDALQAVECGAPLPALERSRVGGVVQGERLHLCRPGGVEEERDGEPVGLGRGRQDAVERGDVQARREAVEDVADCCETSLVI